MWWETVAAVRRRLEFCALSSRQLLAKAVIAAARVAS
jgi:hypothetical protein